ncbi:hypothetical protein GCM10009727_87420 [Actinomadura napierensis]|uniref:Uncharacterized protein n=1 Tax=Actinomadura napierensis TaxID=267854 RepID=A0ABP5MBC4_9ACTN
MAHRYRVCDAPGSAAGRPVQRFHSGFGTVPSVTAPAVRTADAGADRAVPPAEEISPKAAKTAVPAAAMPGMDPIEAIRPPVRSWGADHDLPRASYADS